jgi:hypothetical protein
LVKTNKLNCRKLKIVAYLTIATINYISERIEGKKFLFTLVLTTKFKHSITKAITLQTQATAHFQHDAFAETYLPVALHLPYNAVAA